MSSPPDPSPDVRIGNAERESATQALDEHLSAGRLDPDEYADRVVKVSLARYVADLEPLFRDLPAPHPKLPASRDPVVLSKTSPSAPTGRHDDEGSNALGGRFGETLVVLSPFIATALFFLLRFEWVVFLLIPVVSVVVYGGSGRRRRR